MANGNQEKLIILRQKQVEVQIGLPRSTMYLRIQEGTLTRPVKLGARAVGWPQNEIVAINIARIAGKSDEEIRLLVIQLEAARKVLQEGGEE